MLLIWEVVCYNLLIIEVLRGKEQGARESKVGRKNRKIYVGGEAMLGLCWGYAGTSICILHFGELILSAVIIRRLSIKICQLNTSSYIWANSKILDCKKNNCFCSQRCSIDWRRRKPKTKDFSICHGVALQLNLCQRFIRRFCSDILKHAAWKYHTTPSVWQPHQTTSSPLVQLQGCRAAGWAASLAGNNQGNWLRTCTLDSTPPQAAGC